jgi:hypothetical protein
VSEGVGCWSVVDGSPETVCDDVVTVVETSVVIPVRNHFVFSGEE